MLRGPSVRPAPPANSRAKTGLACGQCPVETGCNQGCWETEEPGAPETPPPRDSHQHPARRPAEDSAGSRKFPE